MTDLKPCPFCGGEPRVIREKYGLQLYQVGCFDPECRGNAFDAPGYDTEDEAEAAWNERTHGVDVIALDRIARSLYGMRLGYVIDRVTAAEIARRIWGAIAPELRHRAE